ncbi:hypothetical protein K227x_23260 [Rubripirellula lacrimiformis]|uniref:Uncharacterized protein n=1 Tax=Rubripirellula lacrimiformis TaxID=1930273 RepID=A0A517N9Y6_9BACT|nr:SPW repeat protein [Rubripirellula lacrimiformis]QDT03940.1 hypothetical protein K227x_23260 [Rubripirellula lacrimiformis]
MSDSKKYIPLSERLQQDVWHDNFVPKYSALASAKPSKLVLIGVWLIFAPWALGAIAVGLSTLSDSPDLGTAVLSLIGPILFCMLAGAILFVQTRRYRIAKLQSDDDGEEAEGARHDPDEGVTKA